MKSSDTSAARAVVGRFAPSPSGPLHFGSVCTAVASYLNAKAQGGRWLVRIDDLDPPREEAGAAGNILQTLENLGLHWDGEVVYQSTRGAAYQAALLQLQRAGLTFECACTRREIGSHPYPGTCRSGLPAGRAGRSLRLRIDAEPIKFHDALQGCCVHDLTQMCGDFIVRRADGLVAYHLAVVVDDAAAGVTEIVRGADLLEATGQQWYLQHCLGLPHPAYVHLPVVLNPLGVKLSKQTGAAGVRGTSETLYHALNFLRCPPPGALRGAAVDTLLQWAVERWRLSTLGAQDRGYPALAAVNMAFNAS